MVSIVQEIEQLPGISSSRHSGFCQLRGDGSIPLWSGLSIMKRFRPGARPIYWKEWTLAVDTHCRHSNQLISISFATSLRVMVAQKLTSGSLVGPNIEQASAALA